MPLNSRFSTFSAAWALGNLAIDPVRQTTLLGDVDPDWLEPRLLDLEVPLRLLALRELLRGYEAEPELITGLVDAILRSFDQPPLPLATMRDTPERIAAEVAASLGEEDPIVQEFLETAAVTGSRNSPYEATVTLTCSKTIAELGPIMDPQGWDDASWTFIEARRTAGDVPRGSDWSGDFLEVVGIELFFFEWTLTNSFDVTFDVSVDRIDGTYDLTLSHDGKIAVDEGSFTAVDRGADREVTGIKRLEWTTGTLLPPPSWWLEPWLLWEMALVLWFD